MPVITMPRLSDTMSEGTVARWLKKEGEEVSKGEILAEIETDKATMELEAFDSGRLARIVQPEGATVPVGDPIAIVLGPGEQMPAETGAAAPAPVLSGRPPSAPTPERPAEAAVTAPAAEEAEERVNASPVARRMATDLGVDLRIVTGTGPGGRIVREDVEKYARESPARASAAPPALTAPVAVPPAVSRPAATPSSEDVEYVDLSTMQRTIVRRMVESKTTIPDFTVTSAIRMDAASDLRSALNTALEGEVRISYNDLVLKAVALALGKFPEVNGSFRDNRIVLNHRVHVGFAAAMAGGLVVPVVRDCDKKSLKAIAQETAVLTEKARQGKLTLAEMEGSTFNVSNMGMYDVEHFEAIITPPNSAVLAVGSVRDEPVVDNGQLAVGKMMKVTLSCDHRVFYGATAAQFLQEIKRLLERPMNLIM